MRTLAPAISSAMVAPTVRGIYFVKLAFDAGSACWHSGFGDYSFGGDTYLGAGALSSVAPIKDETGLKAAGATVGVSGVNSAVVAALIGTPFINRKAFIYFMPLDEGDQPVTANPYMIFKGTIDDISGQMGATSGFTVTLKSRFADWQRPVKILYTDVQQQMLHPGDTGLQFVAQISQKQIIWPQAKFLPDPRG